MVRAACAGTDMPCLNDNEDKTEEEDDEGEANACVQSGQVVVCWDEHGDEA